MLVGHKKNKKFVCLFLMIVFVLQSNLYAKESTSTRIEFDRPEAESNNKNISETIIYDNNSYKEYNPLNPVPVGVNKDEYDSVDNFNIDINTVETRIKYFSPTYLNIKKGAETSYWMMLYSKGGSIPNISDFRDFAKENRPYMNAAKASIDMLKSKIAEYSKDPLTPAPVINELKAKLQEATVTYTSLVSACNVVPSAKYMSTLNQIANIDSNHQVMVARDQVTKAFKGLIISYKQLEKTIEVLNGQEKLYKQMYETYLRNYQQGVATALDVSSKLSDYEDTKASKKELENNFKNLKEQLCLNLGYSLDDIDKINVIEPEIDLEYLLHINIDDDREKAYNSNSAYQGIKLSSRDKKLPGSTGEDLFRRRQKNTAEKVVVALEDAYAKLQAAIITYNGCEYLKEKCNLDKEAIERKKNNNLLSDVEYIGLKVQNLSDELSISNAKYDLINATCDYFYGVLGQLDIS